MAPNVSIQSQSDSCLHLRIHISTRIARVDESLVELKRESTGKCAFARELLKELSGRCPRLQESHRQPWVLMWFTAETVALDHQEGGPD